MLALAVGLAPAATVGLAPVAARAHDGAHERVAPPPADLPPLLYEPPEPGTYELPPIDQVHDHVLIDAAGLPVRFPALAEGQVGIVSFVYASCGQGCPLALATLKRLDTELAARPALAGKVRLVTVSFDPERDTPGRMGELRAALAPRSEWRFVTAPDAEAVAPVLADYGQRVVRKIDPTGADTGLLSHVIKVYLVDEFLRIRNVYSAGLMDARLILNDVQTVLAE